MNNLILFSIGIFTAYLILLYVLFKWLPSVSQSYYEFKEKYGEKYTWVFTVVLLLFAIPLMIAGLSKTEGNSFQFLMFIAPVGIIFTAVAPRFKEDLEKQVHYRGALVGFCGSILSILFTMQFHYVAFFSMTVIALLGWSDVKNKLFWLELFLFYLYSFCLLYL